MKNFQRLTLTFLTTLALTTQVNATSLDITSAGNYDYTSALTVGTLHKKGAGTITLTSTSNSIGTLDIQAGAISISAITNLKETPAAVSFTTTDGGLLKITSSITDVVNADVTAADGGIEVAGSTTAVLGTLLAGATQAGATDVLTKSGAGTLKVTGDNLAQLGEINISAGTLVATTDNSLPAKTTIAAGTTLALASGVTTANEIAVSTSGNIDVGSLDAEDKYTVATLGGTAAKLTNGGRITKTGQGILELTGDKSDATTGFTLSAGTLRAGAANVFPASGSPALNLSGGTLDLTSPMTLALPITMTAATTLATGANAVTLSGDLSESGTLTKTGASALTLSGNNASASAPIVIGAGASLSVGEATNLPGAGSATLTLANSATLRTTANVTPPKGIILDGHAILDAGGATTISNGLSATGEYTLTKSGVENLVVLSNIRDTNPVPVISVINASTFIAGGAASLPATTSLVNDSILSLTTDGAANSGALTSIVLVKDADHTATLSGTAEGFDAAADSHVIEKIGAGALTLSDDKAAACTSGLLLTAGKLNVGDANNFPQGTVTLAGGTLALTTVAMDNSKALAVTGPVTLLNAVDVTQSGAITGAAVLTKSGTGTLELGSTSNTAPITVSAGTLRIGGMTCLPTGVTTTINSGSTLKTTAAIVALDGSRVLNMKSGSILELGGNFAAAVTID
jgi:fibronectin-binding autotransporter adhesin